MEFKLNNWYNGELVTPTDMKLITSTLLNMSSTYNNNSPFFNGFQLSINGTTLESIGGFIYFGTTSDPDYIENSGTNQVFAFLDSQKNIAITNINQCYVIAIFKIASIGRVSTITATIATSNTIPNNNNGIIIANIVNKEIKYNKSCIYSAINNYFKQSLKTYGGNNALEIVNPTSNNLTTVLMQTQNLNDKSNAGATTEFVQNIGLPIVGTTVDSYQQVNSYSQGGGMWFLCNGQAISRTQYPKLFALIGETFGKGDGVNTFNIPDERGRVGAMCSTAHPFGTAFGSDAVAVVLPAHQHTMNGYNAHIHGDDHKHTDLGHKHLTSDVIYGFQINEHLGGIHTISDNAKYGGAITNPATGIGNANISYKSQVPEQTANTGPVFKTGTNTTDLTGTANASISVIQPTIYKNVYVFAL